MDHTPSTATLPIPKQTGPINLLLVDDEPSILVVLSRWLEAEGYLCTTAQDGLAAWQLLQHYRFDALVTDIMMPGLGGLELLRRSRQHDPDLAVIMITGLNDRDTANVALQQGAYGYIIKPFEQNEVMIALDNALERRRLQSISQQYERYLEEKVQERTAELRRREEEVTLHLVAASEYRDEDTGRHIRRIGLYTSVIARALGWSEALIDVLRLAAPMHDVGKIGIPDQILLKQGKLTETEFDIMKRHTLIGASILGNSDIPHLSMGKAIALQHHERWDGTGYPECLQGEAIEECARIVAIVDVYDALVTDRIYRPAFPEEEALSMMRKTAGKHFDPRLFACFLECYGEIRRIRYELCPDPTTYDLPTFK